MTTGYRFLACCALSLTSLTTFAADNWYFFQREEGCLSFALAATQGHRLLTVPADVKTPDQVLAHMKRGPMPDAVMTSVLDYNVAKWGKDATGAPAAMTRKNAFVIHPKDDSIQVVIFSGKLCEALGMIVPVN
jgi:hypothetical protein